MFKTRKFIAIAVILAWIIFTAFVLFMSAVIGIKNSDMMSAIYTAYASTSGLIVGFYFGKSTAIEGVNDGKTGDIKNG